MEKQNSIYKKYTLNTYPPPPKKTTAQKFLLLKRKITQHI